MSLDVYLSTVPVTVRCECVECGNLHTRSRGQTLYDRNITHNLAAMAREVGIYEALWRPDEIGIVRAAQLVPLLEEGLDKLRTDPERCRQHNPENGWGNYEGLLDFVRDYLKACRENPDALVSVSR